MKLRDAQFNQYLTAFPQLGRQTRWWSRLWAVYLLFAFVFLWTAPVSAQQQRAILWLVETADDATVEQQTVANLLGDLLRDADDAEHIIELEGIAQFIERHGYPIPQCLLGMAECDDVAATVAEAMRIDFIAVVRVFGAGERMTLSVGGAASGSGRTLEFVNESLRLTAFDVVTEFVGSAGYLTVTSQPTGAEVLVGGSPVGETPFQGQFPIGIYDVRIELDGYQAFEQTIELRPNQNRLIDGDLDRLYAQLTIRSLTPQAVVLVDSEPLGNANQTLRLQPGSHIIRVEAEGYTAEERSMDFLAGVDREVRFDLTESPEAIRARRMQYIYQRPFFVQGAFRYSGTTMGYGHAEGDLNGSAYTVQCPRSHGGECDTAGIPTNMAGVEVSLGYSFRFFEIELVSLSYSIAQISDESGGGRTLNLVPTGAEPTAEPMAASFDTMTRFAIDPLALGVRFLLTDAIAVFTHGGVGWYSDTFALVDDISRTADFGRTGWDWKADVGLRYHINETVYVNGAFILSDDLTYDDVDLTYAFMVGMGITWEDVIGIDSLFESDPSDDDDSVPSDELSWARE